MNALIEIQYLPSIRYFTKFFLYDHILIDDTEAFQKQSYRNRCHILAANGILPLIVPVYRSRAQLPVREVKIDNHTDWQRMHWQSIQSAYGKAPFYEYYIDGLAKFYSKKDQFTYLFDLNCSLFEYLLPKAGIELEKMQFLSEKTGTEHYEDLCSNIHPKEKYDKSDPAFVPRKYIQVFSDRYEFIPNLSIIDLLFNEGPNTAAILQQSTD